MSMFLVECSELNQKLIEICEKLIQKILKKIEDLITYEQANNVVSQVRNITGKFSENAETSALLVENEGYFEDVKNQ